MFHKNWTVVVSRSFERGIHAEESIDRINNLHAAFYKLNAGEESERKKEESHNLPERPRQSQDPHLPRTIKRIAIWKGLQETGQHPGPMLGVCGQTGAAGITTARGEKTMIREQVGNTRSKRDPKHPRTR